MRAIWSQAARPRLSCHSAPRDSTTSILSRGSTTSRLPRRFTFNDAFTILLAPVLATAFVADTSWKEKKRRDWDQKLAEINEEIDLLRAREVDAWSRLQVQSARIGARHQRRSYSSVAYAHADVSTETGEYTPFDHDDSVLSETQYDNDTSQESAIATWPTPNGEDYVPDEQDLVALRLFERLIAVRLVLQMIVHVQTGTSIRRWDPPQNYVIGDNGLPENLSAIAKRLSDVNHQLFHVGAPSPKLDPYRVVNKSPDQVQLHEEVKEVCTRVGENNITIPQMVEFLALKILGSSRTPAVETYLALLQTLSWMDQPALAHVVLNTLKNCRLPLDNRAVYLIIMELGRRRDVARLEELFNNLTLQTGTYNARHKWEWLQVSGSRIAVPISRHSRLLQVLVVALLRCHQTRRAEAYAALLKDHDYGGEYKVHLFKQFLAHYSIHVDWHNGLVWIQRAIQWAVSVASNAGQQGIELGRLIFRILDLCVSCGKREDYERIMDASIVCGINPPVLSHRSTARRSQDILAEWERIYKNRGNTGRHYTPEQSAIAFRNMLKLHYPYRLEQSPQLERANETEFSDQRLHSNSSVETGDEIWRPVLAQQQETLEKMKAELEELKREKIQMSKQPQVSTDQKEDGSIRWQIRLHDELFEGVIRRKPKAPLVNQNSERLLNQFLWDKYRESEPMDTQTSLDSKGHSFSERERPARPPNPRGNGDGESSDEPSNRGAVWLDISRDAVAGYP